MRLLISMVITVLLAGGCGSGDQVQAVPTPDVEPMTAPEPTQPSDQSELGPGGYGFDRSDPETGIANIMESFAADEVTATCIFDAWGDVANVAPEELTPELMTFEICGTSIFQMMTGDPRFTGDG